MEVKLNFIILSVLFNFINCFEIELKDGEAFDFIIVGGGTAGCVVAARLAENGKHRVLLIEEGGIPNPNMEIPALVNFQALQTFPNEVKFYSSVPQRNAALARNGTIQYPIGKTLGGGSSVNSMVWNRGHPQDYNNWAKKTKDSSWSYENMLKYFQKSENYSGFNPTRHKGYDGPITITNPVHWTATGNILEAGREIGYPFGDANGPQTPSVAKIDFAQDNGRRRVSSYSGYIKPMLKSGENYEKSGKSSNLLILLNTQAKRIIFEGRRAVGVTFTKNNSSRVGFAKATKEIIISAGALDSPALLQRSGIGPESVLKKAGIPIVKELPVGRNLQNHASLMIPIIMGNRSAALVPSRDLTPEAWRIFQERGEGAYSSYNGRMTQGFFLSQKTSRKPKENNWPDIHLLPQAVETSLRDVVKDLKPSEVLTTWMLLISRPKSKGTVNLNPNRVDGQPLIDFKVLSHEDDQKVMLDGIRICEKLCEKTKAMKRVGCRFTSTVLPACKNFKFRSDSYWNCYVRQMGSASIHAAGTCRMGSGDKKSVVDSQLKVIGIEGLRVADASVMPAVTNANTQAPVYAIAEKAAEMILKKWEKN